MFFQNLQSMQKDLCCISKISQTLKTKIEHNNKNFGYQTNAVTLLKNEYESFFPGMMPN